MATENFYEPSVFADALDYTIIDEPTPLVDRSMPFIAMVGAAATVAVLAATLSFSPASFGSAASKPFARSWYNETKTPDDRLADSTRIMLERAKLARAIFRHVPHAGLSDPDPDYGSSE